VLVVLFLALLGALSAPAQSIEAGFSTEKTNYLVGEPIFITLTVSNKTGEAIWLDLKVTGFPFPCNDFDIEVPGAGLASDGACGSAGSCGRGFREVQPLKTILIRRLVDATFRIRQPGLYEVRVHAIVSVHHQNLFESLMVKKVARRAEVKGHRHRFGGSSVLLIEAADNPRPVHKLCHQTQDPKQDHHLESPRARPESLPALSFGASQQVVQKQEEK
jgi:hypothetical protein